MRTRPDSLRRLRCLAAGTAAGGSRTAGSAGGTARYGGAPTKPAATTATGPSVVASYPARPWRRRSSDQTCVTTSGAWRRPVPRRWCADCRALFTVSDQAPGLRCPACQAIATAKRQARPSSSKRGLGWAFTRRKQSNAPDAVAYRNSTTCQCTGCPQHTGLCGKPFTTTNPKTAGHTTPRSRGGHGSPIRPVCRQCNSSDGGRLATRTPR